MIFRRQWTAPPEGPVVAQKKRHTATLSLLGGVALGSNLSEERKGAKSSAKASPVNGVCSRGDSFASAHSAPGAEGSWQIGKALR